MDPEHLLVGRWHTIRHLFHTSEDGFIIRPAYMGIHVPDVLHSVIGQLWTFSHQLHVEEGGYVRIALEKEFANWSRI